MLSSGSLIRFGLHKLDQVQAVLALCGPREQLDVRYMLRFAAGLLARARSLPGLSLARTQGVATHTKRLVD